MPQWVKYMLTARWLKIAPWELMERDDAEFWIEAAGIVSNAEYDAAERKKD